MAATVEEQLTQALEALRTQQAQFAELQQTVQAQRADLIHLRDQALVQEGRLQAAVAAAAPGGGGRTLVDTRGIGKPSVFDSDMKKWKTWSFKYTNFATAVYAKIGVLLDWAIEQQDPIDDLLLADLPGGITADMAVDLSQQIYTSVAQLVDGEALAIVQNVIKGRGLEAWRRLSRRFDPQTAGRRRNIMGQILYPGQQKLHELSAAIERWEELIRTYEGRSQTKVPDEILGGILVEMCPEALRNHLYLNANKLKGYDEVKEEIVAFLETRHGNATGAGQGPTPMDIGAMTKGQGGKGTGKGNSGKGSFSGVCFTCGRTGHRSAECRSGGGGKGAQKGKGKDGKGKGNGSQDTQQKGKGKGKGKAQPFQGYCSACWRWGHRAADCRSTGGGKGVNAVAETQQHQQPEADQATTATILASMQAIQQQLTGGNAGASAQLASLGGLCSLGTQIDALGTRGAVRPYRVTGSVDSGAAATVIPVSMCSDYALRPTRASESGATYKAANGAQVRNYGMRTIIAQDPNGDNQRLRCNVADVHKMLLSVSATVDMGHTVIFSKAGSAIVNDTSGKIIPLRREDGVYLLDLDVYPANFAETGGQPLLPLDGSSSSATGAGASMAVDGQGPGGSRQATPHARADQRTERRPWP